MRKFHTIIDEYTCLGCRVADMAEMSDEDALKFNPHDEDSEHRCRCYWQVTDISNDLLTAFLKEYELLCKKYQLNIRANVHVETDVVAVTDNEITEDIRLLNL